MSHMWCVPLIPGQPMNIPLWFRKTAAERAHSRARVLVWMSLNVMSSAIITPSHATWNKYNLTHKRTHTQTHSLLGSERARVWYCCTVRCVTLEILGMFWIFSAVFWQFCRCDGRGWETDGARIADIADLTLIVLSMFCCWHSFLL